MQSWITVSVFCILIFGFSIATLVKPSAEFSETENRVLRQMPEIKTAAILSGDFESDYEQYLTDQLFFGTSGSGENFRRAIPIQK